MPSEKEFKVNEYIKIKLEKINQINVYINDKKFKSLHNLVIQLPFENRPTIREVNSIDELEELYEKAYINIKFNRSALHRIIKEDYGQSLTLEEEFWAHCSNIQVWAENNYDTRLLHRKTSFPLLKRLTEIEDPNAKKVLIKEISKRIESGNIKVINYLFLEGYTEYLPLNLLKNKLILKNLKLVLNDFPQFIPIFEFYIRSLGNGKFSTGEIRKIIQLIEATDFNEYLWKNQYKGRYIVYRLMRVICKEQVHCRYLLENFKKRLENNKNDPATVNLTYLLLVHSDEEELNKTLGDSLPLFLEIFFKITMEDGYYYYYDVDLWKKVGVSISKIIREDIEECVRTKNLERFCDIYKFHFFDCLNLDDLIYIFSFEKLNLINFLRIDFNNTAYYETWFDGFRFEKLSDIKISKVIREAVIKSLEEREVEIYDLLFFLDFFSLLTIEDLNLLEKKFNISIFRTLMLYRESLGAERSYKAGLDDFKNYLKKKNIKLTQIITNVIKNKNYKDLFLFWDNWIWDVLNIEDLKELIENENINFIECLLKSAYNFASTREVEMIYVFPEKVKKNLREQMKQKIISILSKNEIDLFIALLAMRLLDFFNPHELLQLIEDKQLNLLERIDDAIEHHYSKIMELNEGFYRWKINFYKFLSKFNIPISDKIDRLAPSETLIFQLSPPDEEVDDSEYFNQPVTETKEFVSIAGRQIQVQNGVLDLSGLNLFNITTVEGLFKLKSLRVLSLSNNFITKLPESIVNLISLEKLIIEKCKIEFLPESIGNLKNLKHLNLHRNQINELPMSFGNLEKLESLDLSFNNIIFLPSSFRKLVSLKRLNLRNNQIKTLPSWMGNLKKLKNLNLMVNRELRSLPDSIGELDSLEELNLFSAGIVKVPSSIGKLKSLKRLCLSCTYILELPESIGDLISLEELDLNTDPVFDQVIKIPASILKCKSLKNLKIGRKMYNEFQKIIKILKEKGVKVYH